MLATMAPYILILLLLAGVASAFLFRQSERGQLRAQNEQFRQLAAEALQLTEENPLLEEVEIDQAELERLRPLVLELAGLRAQIPQLRAAAKLNPELATEQITRAMAEAKRQQERLELIKARQLFRQRNKEIKEAMNQLLNFSRMVASPKSRHNTTGPNLPASFPELQTRLTAYETALLHYQRSRSVGQPDEFSLTNIDELLATHFKSSLAFFEFVPQPKPPTLFDPPPLLLRERLPRPHPDGGWIRIYGLSDGTAEEVILPENRFDQWEESILR